MPSERPATATPPLESEAFTTAAGRRSLTPRRKPYWLVIGTGCHLGLYRGVRQDTWLGRWHRGRTNYEQTVLGPASGDRAIDFDAACALVTAGRASIEAAKTSASPAAVPLVGDNVHDFEVGWAAARPELHFSLDLIGAFMRISSLHAQRSDWLDALAAAHGLGKGDLYVLGALRRALPRHALRPTDLYKALVVTSGTISKRIDKLESAGLVRRVAGTGDRRSWTVELTAAGVERADVLIDHIARMWSSFAEASGFSRRDTLRLDRALRTLMEVMPGVVAMSTATF